jgi:hypothetical protein
MEYEMMDSHNERTFTQTALQTLLEFYDLITAIDGQYEALDIYHDEDNLNEWATLRGALDWLRENRDGIQALDSTPAATPYTPDKRFVVGISPMGYAIVEDTQPNPCTGILYSNPDNAQAECNRLNDYVASLSKPPLLDFSTPAATEPASEPKRYVVRCGTRSHPTRKEYWVFNTFLNLLGKCYDTEAEARAEADRLNAETSTGYVVGQFVRHRKKYEYGCIHSIDKDGIHLDMGDLGSTTNGFDTVDAEQIEPVDGSFVRYCPHCERTAKNQDEGFCDCGRALQWWKSRKPNAGNGGL